MSHCKVTIMRESTVSCGGEGKRVAKTNSFLHRMRVAVVLSFAKKWEWEIETVMESLLLAMHIVGNKIDHIGTLYFEPFIYAN